QVFKKRHQPKQHTPPTVCSSFVFTSSKYDADGNIANQHTHRNRPYLTQEQLRWHGAGARNSSSLGVVLPGFIPIRSANVSLTRPTTTLPSHPSGSTAVKELKISSNSSSSS